MNTSNNLLPLDTTGHNITIRPEDARLNGHFVSILSRHNSLGLDAASFHTHATDDYAMAEKLGKRYMRDNRFSRPYVIIWDRKLDKLAGYYGPKAGFAVLDHAMISRYVREEA